ncbi:hypothetical protein HK096_001632, partial [Nowakowskiella sp. JEL0078]
MLQLLKSFIFNGIKQSKTTINDLQTSPLVEVTTPSHTSFSFISGKRKSGLPFPPGHPAINKPLPRRPMTYREKSELNPSNFAKDNGELFRLPVPSTLYGTKYATFLHYLLEHHNALPIALYRVESQDDNEDPTTFTMISRKVNEGISKMGKGFSRMRKKMSGKDVFIDDEEDDETASENISREINDDEEFDQDEAEATRYVVLNPRPKLRLKRGDHVYVFAAKKPVFPKG